MQPLRSRPADVPVGLLVIPGPVDPEDVRAVLDDQRGPAWDDTAFQALTGVDALGLAAGEPAPGSATCVTIASSGWWLRELDDLADRLATRVGVPVAALVEAEGARTSGFHVAVPGMAARRQFVSHRFGEAPRAWAAGLGLALGRAVSTSSIRPLSELAAQVRQTPAVLGGRAPVALFGSQSPAERQASDNVRGRALVAGLPWRPGSVNLQVGELPRTMPAIVLTGPVRLPGPPRHAIAARPDSVATVLLVIENRGWVCLVPELDGAPARFGSAVRVEQFAPMADGRWIGVLDPHAAVVVGTIRDNQAEVLPVIDEPAEPTRMEAARMALRRALAETQYDVAWTAAELDAEDDPARLLAWQFPVSVESSLTYLAANHAAARAELVARALLE